jgi:transcriptional regulator with XRE-family HTH domain
MRYSIGGNGKILVNNVIAASRGAGEGTEENLSAIGERLKRARLERGLTLRKLAGEAGVAPATIQKIEAGRLVPSIEIFVKVVKALRLRASHLLGEEDGPADVRIIRADTGKSLPTGSRIRIQTIAEALREPKMEAFMVKIPPRAGSGRPLGFSGEILFICKKGTIEFSVRGRQEVLRKGDTLHIKAVVPHRFENRSAADAELLAIWSPS